MISHEGKVYLLIKEATELTLFNDNAVLSNISVTTCIVISLDVKLILVQYRVYKTIFWRDTLSRLLKHVLWRSKQITIMVAVFGK